MMVLRVDGVELPLGSLNVEMPGYDARRLHSVAEWRDGSSVVVEVVSSPESDRVLCNAFDLHSGSNFNDGLHSATLEVDGSELISGKATLLATEHREGVCYYRLSIRSGGSEWADMVAKTGLSDANISCTMRMTPYDIERSWSGEQTIRFLPLQRDSYPTPHDSGLWGEQRVLMPTDYHPFISVRDLLYASTAAAGYRLQSSWANSNLVRKLMISGAYRRVDADAAERAMGFKAYRTQTLKAKANNNGYVFAWNPVGGANVGVIVDSVDPEAQDDEERSYADAYSNGGAMRIVNGSPVFTPTRDISVSYEYKIRYRTDYRITSSRYLTGFDRIYLGTGCDVELKLNNPFVDQSLLLESNMSYRLFIFDYDANCEYKLLNIGLVNSAVSEVITPKNCSRSTQLYVRQKGASTYSLYMGDWALYNGFVEERGERDVELVVRTPYKHLAALSEERFAEVSFYGAEPEQQLTLYSGCSVRPIFSGSVGYGDSIEYRDVANHDFTLQSLVEALIQMFNLCVYAHQESRTLVIEPYDDFFTGDVVDLRARQLSQEWSIVEGAPESLETVRLSYAGSDGVVARENLANDKEFGLWSRHFESYATKQGVDTRVNPVFYPTLSLSGYIGSVPSAEVLTVGDREMAAESDYVEPRVVLYHGLRSLPRDECWVAYTSANRYPYAAFHSASALQSLCFEDRDGCQGLHSYHDTELNECVKRGSLRCKIMLPLTDYLSLLDPNSTTLSIRSRFRLEINGASSLYTLRAVESYDALRGVATCLFRRTMSD